MRAATLKQVLDATSLATPGAKVGVRLAHGWTHGDVRCDEPGMILTLRGEKNDARLLELAYVFPVDAGQVVPCPHCKTEFASTDYLGMHTRRRHDPRKPSEAVIHDPKPGELAAAMAARDQRGYERGSAAAEGEIYPLKKRNELRERERKS